MHDDSPRLTDEDLRRLAQLGGTVEQIAEAAGIDAAQVRRRLAAGERRGWAVVPARVLVTQAAAQR
ncbi:MAG: hypothetical protein ACRYG2_26595 [Janthinobacterium lividum]